MPRLTAFLSLFLFSAYLLACGGSAAPGATPQTVVPTPDIGATVAALVEQRMASIPTPTNHPTLTPAPTYTPYPSPTSYPSPTPQPTATFYPTYTPYPTPASIPTATPYPTYTPYPTPTPELRPTPTLTPWPDSYLWETYTSPHSGFVLSYPYDWVAIGSENEPQGNYAWFTHFSVYSPDFEADVSVLTSYSFIGWDYGPGSYADLVSERLRQSAEEKAYGLESLTVTSLTALSPTVVDVEMELRWENGCAQTRYERYFALYRYEYQVTVSVCRSSDYRYDADLAREILDRFRHN